MSLSGRFDQMNRMVVEDDSMLAEGEFYIKKY